MVKQLPKIERKIHAFLLREEGKISKEALLKTGIVLSAAALSSVLAAQEVPAAHNILSLTYDSGTATGSHSYSTATATATGTATGTATATGTGTYY